MGINLESSLSSYAQAAGVSQSALNNSKTAVGAADKILEAVASSPSASKQVIDTSLSLDAAAVAQSPTGSKDSFADFQNHVSQLVSNSSVSSDLAGLADANAITDNSTINEFVTALGNTLQGGGAGAMELTSMTAHNGNFSKHGIHHDDTKVTASVGTGSSAYTISFDQRNSADNVLHITDPDGNDVPIPASLKGGNASGSMTLPGGTKITINGSGKNCSFTVTDPQGKSQTATFHGAGDKGSHSISPPTTGSAASASSGSGASSPSSGINFNPETDLDPLWISSTESALAQDYADKYGVSPEVFENGASDEWIQGNHPGAPVAQELSGDAQDTGLAGEVYRAGEEFAAHYEGGGRSTTPSVAPQFIPLPDASAPNSGAQGNTDSSASSASASGSATGGSNGATGANAGGPIPGQNWQLDPTFVANLETQALNQIPTQLQALFTAAVQDVWGNEWNKGASTLSPAGQAFQAGELSGEELQAYQLGVSFAKKYFGGGTQTTLSGNH